MSKLWLPFTQMRDFDAASRTFVRGQGAMLEDARGNWLYDAVSSIWTTIHGHSHPYIVEAICVQAERLDHSTLLGATNPQAESLAERLCDAARMDRAFFASDGASAIEAALKMSLQYWQNIGQPQRTRFVRLGNAYHGDTVGAMSVSDITLFKSRFASVTFETQTLDTTANIGDDVAGVIFEPLVSAASGMRLVPAQTYERLAALDTLLICDEIATGFGRTGTFFAYEQTGLLPDILCLGKGITGGTLALSATLVREQIYEAFLGEAQVGVHFFHGHSYAGNPIACAAAIASLELFEKENTLERVAAIANRSLTRLDALRSNPQVSETRQAGTMIGIELLPGNARNVAAQLYEKGHFTRPIGEVVQFVPPLCSTDAQVDAFFDALESVAG